jgi:hypothetical protein
MNVYTEQSLDPRLRHYLGLLRPVPPRDPLAAARAKVNFLNELEVLFELDRPPQPNFISSPTLWFNSLNIWIKKPLVSFCSFFPPVLSFSSILVIVLVLLFGWVGITAQAAETALPGDTLYSFKTGMEQVQISLAGDLDKQAALYLEFASHRLQEINKLVDSERYQKAITVSEKFRLNIQRALEIMDRLAVIDPANAAQRQSELKSQLEEFTVQINELLAKLPSDFQPAFNNMLPPIQPGSFTPVTPGVTLTPTPGIEQNGQPEGNTDQQNNLMDDTETDNNQGTEKDPDKEQDSGKSSDSDSEVGSAEVTGAYEYENTAESTPEGYDSEIASPHESQSNIGSRLSESCH